MLSDFSFCSVYFNGDVYYLRGMSKGTLRFVDPEIEPVFIRADVSDDDLGAAILGQMAKSRKLELKEFMKIVNEKTAEITADKQIELAVDRFGYSSRKALFKNMKHCIVSVVKGEIEVMATVRKGSSEDFKANTSDPSKFLPLTASSKDVAVAVKAFLV